MFSEETSSKEIRRQMSDVEGVRRTTATLQLLLNEVRDRGYGEVTVPRGRHVVGTLRIYSNTTLILPHGSALVGSTEIGHYPQMRPALRSYTDNYTTRSILYAERAHHISIVGRGMIDGQGEAFLGLPYLERPYLLRMIECDDVVIRDVEMRDSAMWAQHYLACKRVLVDGINVQSRKTQNNDGIDIDSCVDFRLSNSTFDTEDDAICIKATTPLPTRNITVTNCVMSTDCNAFKIGTETVGSFSDIVLSNSTMSNVGLSAVAIEAVDGGHVERVVISGVTARNAASALFIRLGERGRPWDCPEIDDYHNKDKATQMPTGSISGVMVNNFMVSGCDDLGSSITGTPTVPVRDVTLTNIRWTSIGSGKLRTDVVPELLHKYPEYRMFGSLPSHGLYVRHVEGLTISNIVLDTEAPDARPAIVLDDVHLTETRKQFLSTS